MPLYEYECPSCGVFERVQKFSDPILTTCPTCEKPVEKLLSAPAIQFKGTGWYVTDYAGKGKERETKSKENAGKSGDSDKKASAKTGDDKKSSGAKTSSESGKK